MGRAPRKVVRSTKAKPKVKELRIHEPRKGFPAPNRENKYHLLDNKDNLLCSNGWTDDNCCLFMSLLLSYDGKYRDILSNNAPHGHDPTLYFRQVNRDHDAGTDQKGDGYSMKHLRLYLSQLVKDGSLSSFKIFEVTHKKQMMCPLKFINSTITGKKPGSRYLLFGSAPKSDWNKTVSSQFSKCKHPLIEEKGKIIVDPDRAKTKYSPESEVVMKQETVVFTQLTNAGKYHSLKTNTHASCIAYYPASMVKFRNNLWEKNNLVPMLFDNGKKKYQVCTADALIRTNVNIRRIYCVSIQANESKKSKKMASAVPKRTQARAK